jgi:hypothetical protein
MSKGDLSEVLTSGGAYYFVFLSYTSVDGVYARG